MRLPAIPLYQFAIVSAVLVLVPATGMASVESIVTDSFLRRLATAESGCDDSAVNEGEDAHGRYQIRAAYLADANAYLGTSYTLEEMHEPAKAAEVVRGYLLRYGTRHEEGTGRPVTEEDLARIHNGGPNGAGSDATLGYLRKFREVDMEGVL